MPTEHHITVNDGQKLSVVHHEAKTNKWMIFCHGFGSDKSGSYERRSQRATQEGYNAVRFDFRGNGESDGEFINANVSSRMDDLQAVINHFEPESFFIFGSSFGCKPAFHLCVNTDNFAGIIARSPVTYNNSIDHWRREVELNGSYEHSEGDVIDNRFFEDLDKYTFDLVENEIDAPALIFHGENDESIAFENSIKATQQLQTDVTFEKFHNEGHVYSDEAEKRMLDQAFNWTEYHNHS
jgi:pimeloyl-ACP methyl ester carboxylesterase